VEGIGRKIERSALKGGLREAGLINAVSRKKDEGRHRVINGL